MANLTFFFEAIAEYPEMRATFEKDLGIRRYDPDKTEYGYMFQSLIGAILIIGNEEYDNDVYLNENKGQKEFRFKLLHMLQRLIWYKFQPYILMMFSGNTEVQKTIASDFSRVFGWTGLLAFPVKDDEETKRHFPHRTFEVKSAKETIKERAY